MQYYAFFIKGNPTPFVKYFKDNGLDLRNNMSYITTKYIIFFHQFLIKFHSSLKTFFAN